MPVTTSHAAIPWPVVDPRDPQRYRRELVEAYRRRLAGYRSMTVGAYNPYIEADAVRYRTTYCEKALAGKNCYYGPRCLFAHHEWNLRTLEKNQQDGLVRMDAIRAFQRRGKQIADDRKARAAMKCPVPSMPSVSDGDVIAGTCGIARNEPHNRHFC
ncbi:hypothetical protein STCU_10461 [Strigomonas culicis]|uniref:C3H1-type domain-containing protein n=1 Tax=Strigomonas culicis TaxID=28005 RepID=S9V4A3_9TRYP|nr:hypothetical protein STCU_10461 [Strigomonas culicis]|eukprot:EPY17685.1 hypothetical protein STCU_10461 [Strigomonas culicis]